MEIIIKKLQPNILELSLHGSIMPIEEFALEQKIAKILTKDLKYLIFNLKEVNAVNSVFVSALLLLAKRLSRVGCTLIIRAPKEEVKTLFESLDLHHIIKIVAAFDDFWEELNSKGILDLN